MGVRPKVGLTEAEAEKITYEVNGPFRSVRPATGVPTPPLGLPATDAAPAPKPAPVPAPAPVPVPAPAPSVYYANCTAARAAGAAPVRVGQPGYGRHLDRDGDGIGCE